MSIDKCPRCGGSHPHPFSICVINLQAKIIEISKDLIVISGAAREVVDLSHRYAADPLQEIDGVSVNELFWQSRDRLEKKIKEDKGTRPCAHAHTRETEKMLEYIDEISLRLREIRKLTMSYNSDLSRQVRDMCAGYKEGTTPLTDSDTEWSIRSCSRQELNDARRCDHCERRAHCTQDFGIGGQTCPLREPFVFTQGDR